jgi:hypothetical protein
MHRFLKWIKEIHIISKSSIVAQLLVKQTHLIKIVDNYEIMCNRSELLLYHSMNSAITMIFKTKSHKYLCKNRLD